MTTPATIPAPAGRLGELLLDRMERWQSSTLGEPGLGSPAFWEPDDRLLDHVVQHRATLGRWAETLARTTPRTEPRPEHGAVPGDEELWATDPSALLTRHFLLWVHRHNQFLAVSPAERRRIELRFRDYFALSAGLLCATRRREELYRGLCGLFRLRQRDIAAFVARAAGPRPREVVCAEYSVGLQLRILGITAADLTGPVLDVGCGSRAHLVAALRGGGVDARGFDRDALAPGTWQDDWLLADYGTDRWGLVVSHHALTLHFLHHHLAGHAVAADYAGAFMRVLASLRPGGSFCYAPALPFLEALLPGERWAVSHPGALDAGAPATRVTRLG